MTARDQTSGGRPHVTESRTAAGSDDNYLTLMTANLDAITVANGCR